MQQSISPLVLVLSFSSIILGYGPHHPKGPHHHYRPETEGGTKLTQDAHLLHDKEHIKEDLKEIINEDITHKMSPQELEFYYFRIHDADNNTKLDGLEILRAIQHLSHEEPIEDDDWGKIIDLIDLVLEEDDLDKDGYLSYVEYVKGRNREERNDVQHPRKYDSEI